MKTDGLVQMMYWYWKKNGIRPSVFYTMPRGELILIQEFFKMELEEEQEKREAFEKNPVCPAMLFM